VVTMDKQPVYCPICGHFLTTRMEGGRPRPACDRCGYVYYHNPVPGVGIVIEKDGGIVLVKRGSPPHQEEWSLPSGFVEADESAEEAALREAEEETGLTVEIVELIGVNSFPEGPPVSGIMIFFRARPLDGELRAGDDAVEARVFRPGEIPWMPFRTHREIVAEWLVGHQREQHHEEAVRRPDQPALCIRPAQPADEDEIMALLALIPANRDLAEEQWQQVALRLHEAPALEVFVAETRQDPPIITGFISLSIVRTLTEGRGFINDMAVLPTYQRRGIGAALLEAVMRRAAQLRLTSLMVNTQRANDQARAFYAALGFSEEGVMRLKIGS
jgi:8-oxo-dGTP diphosphatase